MLVGQSLGGAIVVDLAARTGARALVLESTFSSLKDVATHHYPRLAWLVPAGKLDSAACIAKFKGPLLQCHGDADRTVNVEGTRRWVAHMRELGMQHIYVEVKGGDHSQFIASDRAMLSKVFSFFNVVRKTERP